MSELMQTPPRTVEDEWLAAASAGTLSNAKALLLACQAEIEPSVSQSLAQLDDVGSAMLETTHGEEMSDAFFENLFDAVDAASNDNTDNITTVAQKTPEAPDWMPSALADFLERSGAPLKWKSAGPGVKRASLFESEDGERVYLLKAKPGTKMPEHSHTGEEWTLILQGGYHVGSEAYARGDLHQEDSECQHQPLIDDHGDDCISLVMDEGAVRFANPYLRLLQPFIGV